MPPLNAFNVPFSSLTVRRVKRNEPFILTFRFLVFYREPQLSEWAPLSMYKQVRVPILVRFAAAALKIEWSKLIIRSASNRKTEKRYDGGRDRG